MILLKPFKRDDDLKAGPQALQYGQATRSEVGIADQEPSQFLRFSWNHARDLSIKDVVPDRSDNFSFLRRGNPHSARL